MFFLIFIALSASFFGMFEIMLPSGLANKVDQQADKGGYTGAFFMALAMAILSFSCTGPIVAGLLIKASQGQVLEPIIGMAGFSLIFALPVYIVCHFSRMVEKTSQIRCMAKFHQDILCLYYAGIFHLFPG